MNIPSDELLKENIWKNLIFYRKRAKITQKELADMIGTAPTTISGYERGASTPDIDTLFMLCNALSVGLYEICGISSDNSSMNADENKLLNTYRSLNDEGRKKLLERADELQMLGYAKGENAKMA